MPEEEPNLALSQYKAALNGLRVGLLMVKDGCIIWANRYFLDMFNVAMHTIIGNSPRICFQSDEEFAKSEVSTSFTSQIALGRGQGHDHGAALWCRISCVADPDDAEAGLVWSFTDISEQVIAEQLARVEQESLAKALAHQQALLAKVQVGLVIAKDRKVAWANQCLLDMSGYTAEELFGQYSLIYAANPDDFTRVGTEGYPLLREGKTYSTGLLFKCKDGHVIQTVITGNAINPDDFGEGFIWSFADITEQIKTEARLREAEEREREAVEREHSEAEKMSALSVVVAGVAHEINTPIGVSYTMITHFRKMAKEFTKTFGGGAMKRVDLQNFVDLSNEISEQLVVNISRAADLVKNFKQISVDHVSDEQCQFNLKNHLQDIVTRLTSTVQKTPHKIEIDCPDDINMDSFPAAFFQILSNLVMNSLTHAFTADKAGTMIISARRNERMLFLDFSDNGRGISAKNLPKIFDPFFTTNSGSGGSGLGLSVVFNVITRKLRGRITCRSVEGEGTIFHMEIPFAVSVKP